VSRWYEKCGVGWGGQKGGGERRGGKEGGKGWVREIVLNNTAYMCNVRKALNCAKQHDEEHPMEPRLIRITSHFELGGVLLLVDNEKESERASERERLSQTAARRLP